MSNHLADLWNYEAADAGLMLWTEALKAWRFDVPDGARVLELGCCETDWAARLKAIRPNVQITGIDVRPCPGYPGTFIQADASTHVWEPESFDWVFALGSIEHFGLGWQEYGDPVSPSADTDAYVSALRALVPGGHVWLDVPYTPETMFQTAHWRCYDDAGLTALFPLDGCVERARGFAPNEREFEFSPVRPIVPWHPFYFVARWLTKAA